MKSLLYESALLSFLGGIETKLPALLYRFGGTLGGHFQVTKINFWIKEIKKLSYPKAAKKHSFQIYTVFFCFMARPNGHWPILIMLYIITMAISIIGPLWQYGCVQNHSRFNFHVDRRKPKLTPQRNKKCKPGRCIYI